MLEPEDAGAPSVAPTHNKAGSALGVSWKALSTASGAVGDEDVTEGVSRRDIIAWTGTSCLRLNQVCLPLVGSLLKWCLSGAVPLDWRRQRRRREHLSEFGDSTHLAASSGPADHRIRTGILPTGIFPLLRFSGEGSVRSTVVLDRPRTSSARFKFSDRRSSKGSCRILRALVVKTR